MPGKIIWTVGHSNRSLDEFIAILKSFDIEMLADIRFYPGSNKYPYFNKESFEVELPKNNIQYLHIKDLGGRRKPEKNSINTVWQNQSFRGYADYMQTNTFKNAIELLEKTALKLQTAYMCSEALWWSCHRALVSDYLKVNGWKVLHIMKQEKSEEHPFTKAARIVNGKLNYTEPDLFS